MDIILASSNEHKKKEFARILNGYNILLPDEVGIPFNCVENGLTFAENSLIKAQALYNVAPRDFWILSDDSGLCVDALGGDPGIHTARYGMREDGLELPSRERNALLLENMRGFTTQEERKATFVCALTLIVSKYRIFSLQECVEGHIAFSSFGNGGFGYDPIFFVDEAHKNMAQLDDSQKDLYSHRGRACRHLITLLGELNNGN
ncbi:MAG: non-canonical purine NTP pyrophosphatase [Sphaerochaetaceae bacterium]